MFTEEYYNQSLPILLAMNPEDVRIPNYATEELIFECYKINKLCLHDKEQLVTSGLSPQLIDNFIEKIKIYETAAAKYIAFGYNATKFKQEFDRLLNEALLVRKELIHYCNFAYRKNKNALKALEKVKNGRSKKDKIYDLVSFVELSKEFPDDLHKINFNWSLLEKIEHYHEKLKTLHAKTTVSPKEKTKLADIRNRAYTYLTNDLNKIKEYAQFVFWQDEKRASLYKREHKIRKKNKKVKEKKGKNSIPNQLNLDVA